MYVNATDFSMCWFYILQLAWLGLLLVTIFCFNKILDFLQVRSCHLQTDDFTSFSFWILFFPAELLWISSMLNRSDESSLSSRKFPVHLLCCCWLERSVYFFQIQLISKTCCRTSLVVQWIRICLPVHGTQVKCLVWENSTCLRATKPMCHNYWSSWP